MADFEELKLTVNLTDNASAGLANLRTQITQLAQAAGQVQTALTGVATSATQVGSAAQQATPKVSSQEKALKELARSAEDTGRNLVQMVLASRQGVAGFTELALATRGAFSGLQGVNAGMVELGAASRAMVVGLAGVAIGIGAIGAAVVAYGVSVFKFSKEMFTLSQTAKSLGLTLGTLKNITEQNERFGISVGQTVGELGTLQRALVDLSFSGSKLRETLIGQGLSPKWLDEYIAKSGDAIAQQKMAQEGAKQQYEYDTKVRRLSPTVAAGNASDFLQSIGQPRDLRDRKLPEPLTKEEQDRADHIADQSTKIAIEWAKISRSITNIKDDFLSWGLDPLLSGLKYLADYFKDIEERRAKAEKGPKGSFLGIPYNENNLLTQGSRESGLTQWLKDHGWMQGSGGGGATGSWGSTAPPASGGGAGQSLRDWYGRKTMGSDYHPASFGGAVNDNSSGGRAQAIIKGGVYEALIQFYGFLQGGGTGGVGGVMKASFGGSAGAAAGGGFAGDSFRRAGGSVTGDGGPNGSHVGPEGRPRHGRNGRHGSRPSGRQGRRSHRQEAVRANDGLDGRRRRRYQRHVRTEHA